MAQVTNSCRGYPGYRNYRPFEINVLQKIQHQGWWRARVGKFRWGAMVLPLAVLQTLMATYYSMVFRRNTLYVVGHFIFYYLITHKKNTKIPKYQKTEKDEQYTVQRYIILYCVKRSTVVLFSD